ncbi:hypothetical protein [Streptomyces sp. NPDC058426]|uniref:hypothetical protein n=1 Tax=Streptomyces sp. NPDC058426 TaxID=3346493 RepID=UPI00366836E5
MPYTIEELLGIESATLEAMKELNPKVRNAVNHIDYHHEDAAEGIPEPTVEIHFNWSAVLEEEWEDGPDGDPRELWVYLTPKRWELAHILGDGNEDLPIILPSSTDPRQAAETLVRVLTAEIPIPAHLPQPHQISDAH